MESGYNISSWFSDLKGDFIMKVKIKETGEIKDLEYLIQQSETDLPQDIASEYVYDDENVEQTWNSGDDAEAQMS